MPQVAARKGLRALFHSPDSIEAGPQAPAAEAAVLSLDQATSELAPEPELGRLARLRALLQSRDWSHIDWVPDLAEDIGSKRWLRGFATLAGLALTAFAFWPSFELQAAPAAHADDAVRDEYRSQMIMPLGLGGESGRRMAAGPLVRAADSVPERPRIELAAVLAEGDSFMRMLQRAGVSAEDAGAAGDLVAGAVPLAQILPGTRVDLVLGPRPAPDQPRQLLSAQFRPKLDLQLAIQRQGNSLAVSRQAVAVDDTPLRIRGIVGPSLYRSARAAGAPVSAIQQYLQALDSHVSLEAVQPGDAFDMVISYKRAGGQGEAGQVLYAGLDRSGAPLAELMRWGDSGEFYSADALTRPVVETSTSGLLQPVFGRITSLFGMRRHPILGYARMHAGVDFGAPWGSPIRATAAGVVSYAGWHGGHGNYVRLEHGGGLGSGYGHMSRIAVSPGTRVSAGQVIGFVGSSGLSTGPHLHYEMYRGGQVVNPLGMSFATTSTVVRQVDPKQVAAFKAKLARFKALRPGVSQGGIAMAPSGAPSGRVALR